MPGRPPKYASREDLGRLDDLGQSDGELSWSAECYRQVLITLGLDHAVHEQRVVIQEEDAGNGRIEEIRPDVKQEQQYPTTLDNPEPHAGRFSTLNAFEQARSTVVDRGGPHALCPT